MQTYDAIVIGNGIAGAALSYELAKAGQSVLLMDDGNPNSGTRYSYGGIGYWAGTTELTTTLFRAGFARHQELSAELGAKTQLRELDLLLTVEKGANVDELTRAYGAFSTPPRFLSAKEASEMEPSLNVDVIAGAFTTRHAHVNPIALVAAYNQAFRRLGGHHNLFERDWTGEGRRSHHGSDHQRSGISSGYDDCFSRCLQFATAQIGGCKGATLFYSCRDCRDAEARF